MNHRTMAIIFLIVILLIMPYYSGLKECIENPNYDSTIVDRNKYSELLTDYILLFKNTNQALVNDRHDDYTTNFDALFLRYSQNNTPV